MESKLAGPAAGLRGRFRFVVALVSLIGCVPAWAEDATPPQQPQSQQQQPLQPQRLVFADETAATASPETVTAPPETEKAPPKTVSPSGEAKHTFNFDFTIKNTGGQPGKGSLTINHKRGKGCGSATPDSTPISLQANSVEVQHVAITNATLPAICYLELSTNYEDRDSSGNKVVKEVITSIKQVKLTQEYVTSTVWGPLIVCAVMSVLAAMVGFGAASSHIKTEAGQRFKLGSPAWEFAKSWASTATLAGGVFSATVTFSALPELTQYVSKTGYGVLSLLISLLVVIAPFVFYALRDGKVEPDETTHHYGVVYRGYLPLFLLSCALTLFAGLAQLVVLYLLLREFFPVADPWSGDPQMYLTCVLGLLLWIYAAYSIYLTIRLQAEENRIAPNRPAEQLKGLKRRMDSFSALGINADELIRGVNANALLGEKMASDKPKALSWPVL